MNFDDKNGNGWYLEKGKVYLRVTCGLDIIVPKKLQNYFKNNTKDKIEKTRKETTEMGSAFHGYLEKHFKGEKDIAIDPEMQSAWNMTMEYFSTKKIKPIANEIQVYSPFGYAGTIDMICEVEDYEYQAFNPATKSYDKKVFSGLTYVDFKTGKGIGGTKAMQQLALYKLADEQTSDRRGGHLMVIQPSIAKGTIKEFKCEHGDYVLGKALHAFESWKGAYFNYYPDGMVVAPDGQGYQWPYFLEDSFVKLLKEGV